jgi:hypothetical protein
MTLKRSSTYFKMKTASLGVGTKVDSINQGINEAWGCAVERIGARRLLVASKLEAV